MILILFFLFWVGFSLFMIKRFWFYGVCVVVGGSGLVVNFFVIVYLLLVDVIVISFL